MKKIIIATLVLAMSASMVFAEHCHEEDVENVLSGWYYSGSAQDNPKLEVVGEGDGRVSVTLHLDGGIADNNYCTPNMFLECLTAKGFTYLFAGDGRIVFVTDSEDNTESLYKHG